MLFRNLNSYALSFEIDGVKYAVEPGAGCEVPDAIAFAVKLHGLPLTPADECEEKAAPAADEGETSVPAPTAAQTKHWKRR